MSIFKQFESTLHKHLNVDNIRDDKPRKIESYIFKLNQIVKTPEHSQLLEKVIFGYSYFDAVNQIFVVYSYYAGLIFATRFFPNNYFLADNTIYSFINLFRTNRRIIWDSLRYEIIKKSVDIAIQYKEGMTPELIEKIKMFYKGK